MAVSKLRRIFMMISRGITDKTAVCVWPWEKPLIEEIHGGQAILVSIDDMCSKEGVKSTKKIKLKEGRRDQDGNEMIPEYAPDLRAQLTQMTLPSEDNNPMDDPAAEYGRMLDKYGQHPDIKIAVVDKVFNNERMFRQAMRDFAAGRTPDFLMDDEGSEEESSIAISDMDPEQLREMLNKLGVKFPPKASRAKLEELALDAVAG